jgi:hypothetical protein
MPHDLDLQGVGARDGLLLEDRPHRWNPDADQDEERNHRPGNLQRRVAVNVLRLRLARTVPELEEREDQNAFDEDEDGCSGPDQKLEKTIDVAIDVCSLMEDRVRRALPAGGDQCQKGDRQRELSQPARAGMKRHAKSFYRRF